MDKKKSLQFSLVILLILCRHEGQDMEAQKLHQPHGLKDLMQKIYLLHTHLDRLQIRHSYNLVLLYVIFAKVII